MEIRTRFAPSPTGQVHIGNIRTAIFAWLFTRHDNGKFLLRVEDTDLERSTPEAKQKLFECMEWLGLDYDEEVLYQSKLADSHLAAVKKLMDSGKASKLKAKPGEDAPVVFHIPYDCDGIPFVREAGQAEEDIHPDEPVAVSRYGVNFAQVSKKGKPMPQSACLAGFKNLELLDASGNCLFKLADKLDAVLAGTEDFVVRGAVKMRFVRREAVYRDLIKGELAKPLDNMKDQIIVRSDGSPVFHIANVCDDAFQKVSHIIRGDDHVENTYRHLFLFHALGAELPEYAHLPMIVNEQGKPYSKRDGDAFVGDFKEKGFLAKALFNALALLGWSPGDDREKMSKQEMIESFTLDRVKSAPAQFNMKKLTNLNGIYLAEMSPAEFAELAWEYIRKLDWGKNLDQGYCNKVAELMQSRAKLLTDVESWQFFFTGDFSRDAKASRKVLKRDENRQGLAVLMEKFESIPEYEFTESAIDTALRESELAVGLSEGKLNQALRVAATGTNSGAGINETIALLGRQRSLANIKTALETDFSPTDN